LQENSTFPAEAVYGCVDRMRNPGPLLPGGLQGHPAQGQSGMYVVAGLDPAAVGHTAAVALAVDRHTGRRYVLDVHNESSMTPDAIRNMIYSWTERLGVTEWRVEDNAFQKFLTLDREVNQWLASRGVKLVPHTTGRNKADADFGVASMEPLLRGWKDGWNLLRLPSTNKSYAVKALVEQMVTYYPGTKNKTDCLMALWFAELRARELVQNQQNSQFVDSPWLSPMQVNQRGVLNVYEMIGG
jgi:hypothetical protein